MNIPTTQPAAMAVEVSKSFDGREILGDLDLAVAQGEFVALLGASGSGKTTLLRILAGLEVASSGEVLVPEVRTVVYQEPRLVASMRVWRNVVIGLPRRPGARARPRASAPPPRRALCRARCPDPPAHAEPGGRTVLPPPPRGAAGDPRRRGGHPAGRSRARPDRFPDLTRPHGRSAPAPPGG